MSYCNAFPPFKMASFEIRLNIKSMTEYLDHMLNPTPKPIEGCFFVSLKNVVFNKQNANTKYIDNTLKVVAI